MGWQIEPAAVFEQGNQLVELRTRGGSRKDDAYRMEELLALDSTLRLHLVHQFLKPLRRDCARFSSDLFCERPHHTPACFRSEHGGVFLSGLSHAPKRGGPFPVAAAAGPLRVDKAPTRDRTNARQRHWQRTAAAATRLR